MFELFWEVFLLALTHIEGMVYWYTPYHASQKYIHFKMYRNSLIIEDEFEKFYIKFLQFHGSVYDLAINCLF